MHLRKNILPKSLQDAAVTLFLILMIPLIYYFELFIVLPTFYNLWSLWYTFHFLLGTIILFNICSNLVATMMVDTSINGRIIPVRMEPEWRFCSVCESLAPPRSWHCNTCNVCIIKRDHHCMFTSCCIGFENQRYFIALVFYIFVATLYANYYNLYFVFGFLEFNSWMAVLKLVFPLVTLVMDASIRHLYLFLVLLTIFATVFTGALLVYHGKMIAKGIVNHERGKGMTKYDLGWQKNLEVALGERWYLIWVSPFLESKLPHDGLFWNTRESVKAK